MLVTLEEICKIGKERGIGIAAVNTPCFEILRAAIDAAEENDVPVIIAHAQLHDEVIKIEDIGPAMIAAAQHAKVPVCVHLDHGESYTFCKKAIDMGFTSVMIDASAYSFEENIALTKKVVDYAHSHGVSVEAELGQLPNRESGGSETESGGFDTSRYTNPKLVPEFVEKTKVDALAIAFGTAHGIYKTAPVLELGVVKATAELTNVPLVMHGGSGLQEVDYQNAIKAGITKINTYTYVSYAAYEAVKEYCGKTEATFFHDAAVVAYKRAKQRIFHIMDTLAFKTKY